MKYEDYKKKALKDWKFWLVWHLPSPISDWLADLFDFIGRWK